MKRPSRPDWRWILIESAMSPFQVDMKVGERVTSSDSPMLLGDVCSWQGAACRRRACREASRDLRLRHVGIVGHGIASGCQAESYLPTGHQGGLSGRSSISGGRNGDGNTPPNCKPAGAVNVTSQCTSTGTPDSTGGVCTSTRVASTFNLPY